MKSGQAQLLVAFCLLMDQQCTMVSAFSTSRKQQGLADRQFQRTRQQQPLSVAFVRSSPSLIILSSASAAAAATTTTSTAGGFIETKLRGAAMRLHTKQQAPKEGQVEVKEPREPYTPTRNDYLAFLVDSKHVYEALEEIVSNNQEALAVFDKTGLERTKALEADIAFMVQEYGLEEPAVGDYGKAYATLLREIAARKAIPEFMCHYYNFYFAHTAGGRMIGKQMSALLLEKKTLEFYKVRAPNMHLSIGLMGRLSRLIKSHLLAYPVPVRCCVMCCSGMVI
jgi:Heme oxygenase